MLAHTLSRLVALLPSRLKYRLAALKPGYSRVLRSFRPSVPVDLRPGRITWHIDQHTSQAHLLGSYERYMQQALDRRLRTGDVFYDIGAHVGFHSLYAGLIVGSGGRVFAFEPNPANSVSLQRQIALNQHLPITLCPYALSDRSGTAGLDTAANSSQSHVSTQGRLEVACFRIDDLLARREIAPPNLLKIDVEGHEAAVLRGAAGAIATYRPIILCDYNDADTAAIVAQALSGYNYHISAEQVVLAIPAERL